MVIRQHNHLRKKKLNLMCAKWITMLNQLRETLRGPTILFGLRIMNWINWFWNDHEWMNLGTVSAIATAHLSCVSRRGCVSSSVDGKTQSSLAMITRETSCSEKDVYPVIYGSNCFNHAAFRKNRKGKFSGQLVPIKNKSKKRVYIWGNGKRKHNAQ